jgi:DNA-binding GntR family transcriptional regulator
MGSSKRQDESMLEKIEKQSIIPQIYREIKKNIITCQYKPGTSLEETKLAAQFNVSRTPIRAALIKLQNEGLLSSSPRKGFSVQQLSIHEFFEIAIVRELLEGYSTKMAAGKLQEADIRELEKVREEFKRLQEESLGGTLEKHNELDAQLHGLILRCCGNLTIQRIIQNLSDKIQQIRFTATPQRLKGSIEEHLRIIDNLLTHDGDAAARAMVDHILALKESFHKQW